MEEPRAECVSILYIYSTVIFHVAFGRILIEVLIQVLILCKMTNIISNLPKKATNAAINIPFCLPEVAKIPIFCPKFYFAQFLPSPTWQATALQIVVGLLMNCVAVF